MKFTNEDLYDLLNVKIGDKIRLLGGGGYIYGHIFEIVKNGEYMNGFRDTHKLSNLIDVEFEKVINFKLMSFRYAMQGIENGDDIYIKYKGKYLLCNTYSNSSDFERRVKIVFKENDILTHTIGLFESAYCEFYKKKED
jgi:hypothetical protein